MGVGHQKQINKYFPNRPIAYQPGLAIILQSNTAAIVLGQLIYWHTKGSRKDGYIFKTHDEMRKETGLTRTQQDTALKLLIDKKIVLKKLAGTPAKRHFKVNFVYLQQLIPSLKESCNLVYLNPPNILDDNLQSYTKSTQSTTTNITKEINNDNFQAIKDNLLSKVNIRGP